MEFMEQVKQFSKKVASLKDTIQNEQATKISIIMPFFSMLGYDVFNPTEFFPEFTADFGSRKHYKVDYAIILEGKPAILIECKDISEPLDRHDAQLFGYFVTTAAKFAILTNGLEYRFYTDLDKPNIMDKDPFLSINILDIRDSQVSQLKKFCKTEFDVGTIFSTASDLKYAQQFKQTFQAQLDSPSDAFVRLFLKDSNFGQKVSQNIIDKFRPVLQKALNEHINQRMHDTLTAALNGSKQLPAEATPPPLPLKPKRNLNRALSQQKRSWRPILSSRICWLIWWTCIALPTKIPSPISTSSTTRILGNGSAA